MRCLILGERPCPTRARLSNDWGSWCRQHVQQRVKVWLDPAMNLYEGEGEGAVAESPSQPHVNLARLSGDGGRMMGV